MLYNILQHNENKEERKQIPLFNFVKGGKMANIEEKVYTLLEKTIINLGYDLYDVEYAKEGKDYFLRIFIDKPTGIDLNDCETVNNAITDILDEADYIKEQYFLEVSSTGVEKILRKDKHLRESIGKEIEIKLFKPINKTKNIIGILENFDENNIYLDSESIERKNISQIKLVYNW